MFSSYLTQGNFDQILGQLYSSVPAARERYLVLLDGHQKTYGSKDEIFLFSTPGRTELCGNHTDHQHGRVLAGAVSLDMIAAVSHNNDGVLRVLTQGRKMDEVSIHELQPVPAETNHSASLIRGIAAGMHQAGCPLSGLDIYTMSDVLPGSGLSSSAAFEVLIATILNTVFFEEKLSQIELAKIAQYAENHFFGKPCGLMDQTACALGGCVAIDFKVPAAPVIERLSLDLTQENIHLVIVNSNASHSDLTEEYASIPADMRKVAEALGVTHLRDASEADFYSKLSELRQEFGDKAVLRAAHFFEENDRVSYAAEALRSNRTADFLRLIRESGHSSYEQLQNIYSDRKPNEQAISVALCVAKKVLGTNGSFRVHGGGFAGTIQAFVPDSLLSNFVSLMESTLGKGCCYVLKIRSAGSICIFKNEK